MKTHGDAAQFTGQQILDFRERDLHEFGQLLRGRHQTVGLHQARFGCPQLGQFFVDVDGDANRAALGGQGTVQSLTNPPVGIG